MLNVKAVVVRILEDKALRMLKVAGRPETTNAEGRRSFEKEREACGVSVSLRAGCDWI